MNRMHRYEGEEVIVEFELARCIHTGDCTASLPDVFDTQRTGRWVHPDGAEASEVARVCAECPTGALRCLDRVTGKPMHAAPAENTIQVVADGPLYVHADMLIDGQPLPVNRVALCRCGASRLLPFCDNSHRGCDFEDEGRVAAPEPADAPAGGLLAIEPTLDGPFHVEGPFTLLDHDGNAVCKSGDAWLCRCGGSSNKPYCDGTHKKIGFCSEDK